MTTNYQLMVLRALLTQGWPDNLLTHLLTRCGLEPSGWQELVRWKWVRKRKKDNRWLLTKEGKKAYQQEKKGRYF